MNSFVRFNDMCLLALNDPIKELQLEVIIKAGSTRPQVSIRTTRPSHESSMQQVIEVAEDVFLASERLMTSINSKFLELFRVTYTRHIQNVFGLAPISKYAQLQTEAKLSIQNTLPFFEK